MDLIKVHGVVGDDTSHGGLSFEGANSTFLPNDVYPDVGGRGGVGEGGGTGKKLSLVM